MSFARLMVSAVLAVTIFKSNVKTTEDVGIIFLPSLTENSSMDVDEGADEIPLAFVAFGRSVELRLKKNRKLVASSFGVWRHDDDGRMVNLPELREPRSCHYIHRDERSTAAVSLCEKDVVNALVFLDDVALEITPLREGTAAASNNGGDGYKHHRPRRAHVVKKSGNPATRSESPYGYGNIREGDDNADGDERITVELGVFFDRAGYHLFYPFFHESEMKMRDMLLAYVNGVQALFHHPSLGKRIDVVLVRLELMKSQPYDLPHHEGERERLLDSFCRYSATRNPADDENPDHWDMGLYISGLDFYALEPDGTRNGVTMGLAPVNGVCHERFSCVIAELGASNRFGKPYPSAGFTSVYIAAHEMGHNLGMRHDSSGNSCSKDGFVMSPSRGTRGETTWSPCSREVAFGLHASKPCLTDHRADKMLYQPPGRIWTSKKQCEMLLRDEDATFEASDVCQSLRCKTPNRAGYYYAGPALEGTLCAPRRECRGGECLPIVDRTQQLRGVCRSGCILDSKGAAETGKACNQLPSGNCTSSRRIVLCQDGELCARRRSATDFAAVRCSQFSHHLPELDGNGGGLQAPHEPDRPWIACAIFCRRNDIASFFSPRMELNELGLDPYFPDGTLCHRDKLDRSFYCLGHQCLLGESTLDEDVPQVSETPGPSPDTWDDYVETPGN